jgi:hypothetical protein
MPNVRTNKFVFSFTLVLVGLLCVLVKAEGKIDDFTSFPNSPLISVDWGNKEVWSPVVQDAARDAVKAINIQLESQHTLESVEFESVRVGPAIVYSGNVETKPSSGILHLPPQYFAFSFLQPPESLAYLWNIDGDHHLNPPSLPNPMETPMFPAVDVEGPLLLHLSEPIYDLDLQLPLKVDVGNAQIIKIGEGVRATVSGFSSIELKEYLDLEQGFRRLKMAEGTEEEKQQNLMASLLMQVPQLELQVVQGGKGFKMSSLHRVKVKRVNRNQIELINPALTSTTTSSSSSSSMSGKFHGKGEQTGNHLSKKEAMSTSLERGRQDGSGRNGNLNRFQSDSGRYLLSKDNLMKALYFAFQKVSLDGNMIKRILSGKAEAVTCMLLPLQLKDKASGGVQSTWHVVVARGADGKNRLFSHQEVGLPQALVSVADPALLNGTLSSWPSLVSATHTTSKDEERRQ